MKPDEFALMPTQFLVGLRIAARFDNQWDRAEVIGKANPITGTVKVFFIDYGTTGLVKMKHCKILFESFAMIPRKAIRAALFGIRPINGARLWALNTTAFLVKKIRGLVHRITIVNYHENVSLITEG